MVPSALPDGLAAPDDGALPAWVAGSPDAGRGVGVYLHVPFCTVRCGYCDFNTYTASELGGGASQVSYADTLLTEVELARRGLADAGRGGRPARTGFVGSGRRRCCRRAISTSVRRVSAYDTWLAPP